MLISRRWLLCVWLLLGPVFVPAAHADTADENRPVILVVGDSLSAGYGIAVDAGWVALLQRRLDNEGYGYRVVNASVSGETTGGARARLPRALERHDPAIVVIELGGNDGLRGLPLKQVRGNLEFMIERSQQAGAQVLLLGMRMPPNYGADYADGFYSMYAELGEKYGVAVVRFFLEGVAQNRELMQTDDIHPTASGQPHLLENVWPTLKTLLKK